MYLGDTEIQDIKLGDTQVEKAFLGNELVWEVKPKGEWVQTTDWRKDGIKNISVSNYSTARTVTLKGSLDSIYAVGVTEDHSLANYVKVDTCDSTTKKECGYIDIEFSSGIRVNSVELYMECAYNTTGIAVAFYKVNSASATTLTNKSLDWYTYTNSDISGAETTKVQIRLEGTSTRKSYVYGIRLHAEYM